MTRASRQEGIGRTARVDLVEAVLAVLCVSNAGASSIHEKLLSQGFQISEPTVARLLRELDRLGYTLHNGRLGRRLTPKGNDELERMRDSRDRSVHLWQLLQKLRSDSLIDVINLLIARRGVEREIARSAALNATKKDIAMLKTRYEAARRGEMLEGLHDVLAKAANNPVLESLYQTLTQDPDIKRLIDQIAERHGTIVDLPFNRSLIDAIDRHDGEEAERLIVAHIDELVAMVKEFWRETRE